MSPSSVMLIKQNLCGIQKPALEHLVTNFQIFYFLNSSSFSWYLLLDLCLNFKTCKASVACRFVFCSEEKYKWKIKVNALIFYAMLREAFTSKLKRQKRIMQEICRWPMHDNSDCFPSLKNMAYKQRSLV